MGDFSTASALSRREQTILQTVQTYGKRLFSFVRGRVRTDQDAEDILQDVWLQFSRVLDLDQIEQVSAWLYRVARNRIIDTHRKQHAIPLSDVILDEDGSEESIADLLFVDLNTPETETLRNLFWEELLRALNELPENQRQVFIWNEIEDLTFREISERTGENIKTLISRKRYAVSKLRARMQALRDDIVSR